MQGDHWSQVSYAMGKLDTKHPFYIDLHVQVDI